jgi:hypothetical protein
MHIAVDEKEAPRSEPGEANALVCLHSGPEAFIHFSIARF